MGDDIDEELFDATQLAIYQLLERDCFPRFKQSHFFHEFLAEAENQALLTRQQYEQQLQKQREQRSKSVLNIDAKRQRSRSLSHSEERAERNHRFDVLHESDEHA